MSKLVVCCVRKSSDGTNDIRPNLFCKGTRIQDTSIMLLMADIGRNVFILFIRMRERIEGHDQLKDYITSYYKGLFGAPEEGNFTLDEARTDDITQVTLEENNFLTAPFSEEEISKAVFQMEHNKAPGPDGFPTEFYQHYWETVRTDLLQLFGCLHAGELKLFCLNFREIVLLPKIQNAKRIQ